MNGRWVVAASCALWTSLVLYVIIIALPAPPPKGFGSAKHVLLIGCDGFGGMYLENATDFLPAFRSLVAGGVATFRARNQIPTISAPNWAAVMTGQLPIESGVSSNDWSPNDTISSFPSDGIMPPTSGAGHIPEPMWAVAKRQWKREGQRGTVAMSISWDWLHYFAEPNTVDFLFRGDENDTQVADHAAEMINLHHPQLTFVHFDAIDHAGHAYGWGGDEYYEAAREVDALVGRLLQALQDADIFHQTLVIVVADHGGWRYGHDYFNEACIYIPMIFFGAGISSHCAVSPVAGEIQDLAPTILYALGLAPGQYMSGRVLHEIYC